jgi:hypothetical protein
VFTRTGDGWNARPVIAGEILGMPEINVILPLADIYADVVLPEIEPDIAPG